MKEIIDKRFGEERALYGVSDIRLTKCRFEGKEDGESALKEAKNIELNDCFMDLRYPLWHDDGVCLNKVKLTENCRAALWYSDKISINNSSLMGIKALRECSNIKIANTRILSPEFGWRSKDIYMDKVSVTGEYAFFEAHNLEINNMDFNGKYSFQYVTNLNISNSFLNTKDAFWHAQNVVVRDSTVKGEYLGWYSNNLTFINCKIIGTQPLCYCNNLKIIDCTMEDTDLSFEYSNVEASINGNILSVKNPKSGHIIADKIEEIILTPDTKYQCLAIIEERK